MAPERAVVACLSKPVRINCGEACGALFWCWGNCYGAYKLVIEIQAREVGLLDLVSEVIQIEATLTALYELNIHVSHLNRENPV